MYHLLLLSILTSILGTSLPEAFKEKIEKLDGEERRSEKTTVESTNEYPIEIEDSVDSGHVYFEGDILLTRKQHDLMLSNGTSKTKRQVQTYSNMWRNGPIPYSFSSAFPASRYNSVRAAIRFWEANSCIRFAENGIGRDRIRFINGKKCHAMFGRTGGEQSVSIGHNCDWIGTIAHELEHVFGVGHTQSRYDRDRYVRVNLWNVLSTERNNFVKQSPAYSALYAIPYEFGSVMHYAENDFARIRSLATLVARGGYERYQHSMSNYLPSLYDIKLVNTYYGCYAKCPRKISCLNGGMQNVNDCNRCKCPPGYAGLYCDVMSTTGCDRSITIGTNPETITATAGRTGLFSVTYMECAISLRTAQSGRRIELDVTSTSGYASQNCLGAGVDIRVSRDPAMTGIRLCRPNTRYGKISSDADRMVLNLYARMNYVSFTFTARML